MSGVRLWTEEPGGLTGVKIWRTPGCKVKVRQMSPTRYLLQWHTRTGIGELITHAQREHSTFIAAATAALNLHTEIVLFAHSVLPD